MLRTLSGHGGVVRRSARPGPVPAVRASRASALLTSLVVALVLTLTTACSGSDSDITTQSAGGGNPLADRGQTLVPSPRVVAAAQQARADGDAAVADGLERLAEVPTGIWLTPEQLPQSEVGAYITSVLADAGTRSVPVFVVYGIPDRDCTGGFSSGGLTDDTYLPWVQAIAEATGSAAVVVLEPDAVAATVSCDGDQSRLRLLGRAVDVLAAAGTATYVDAGHSNWIPPGEMAQLLRTVGVEQVRGFATNVANYQPLAQERSYAARLSRLLDGAHYVIDTGRDGDPSGSGTPVTDWCNPPSQALGSEPGFVDDGTALDALLWIKPPAESDGTCHGGPPAGEIWIDRAVELLQAAGW